MTHIGEREFTDNWVVPRLEADFGEDSVEVEKYLEYPDGSTGFADCWVEAGDVVLAVEVENDAGHVGEGVRQAEEYAMAAVNAIPLVYIPEDHTYHARVELWRNRIPIVEVET